MTSPAKGPCIVLHRAIKNAGDFLIRDRSLRLLATHRPDLAVVTGEAWRPLREQFDAETLGSASAIVISGGPGYQRTMYPEVYPLGPLEEIRQPVFLMALGSFAYREASAASVFAPESARFLRWVAARGGRLGARDDLSVRLVSGLGVPVTMTGDPAWYDAGWLDREDYSMGDRRIAYTPPANPLFQGQGLRLLRGLARAFGPDRLLCVFHREAQPTFVRECERLGAATQSIADGAEGFATFDDVGLHVGYRVHAHLYCLSHTTPSYLIAEDTRGVGVLETLGALGRDGREGAQGLLATWRRLPRIGWHSTATRRLARIPARIGGLPDVTAPTLELIEDGVASGFAGHRAAKATIRRTLPAMVDMLQAIP